MEEKVKNIIELKNICKYMMTMVLRRLMILT